MKLPACICDLLNPPESLRPAWLVQWEVQWQRLGKENGSIVSTSKFGGKVEHEEQVP